MTFSNKVPGDTEIFSFTWANDGLAVGETIVSASWTVAILSGAETIPTLVTSGGSTISGMLVSQILTGGTAGIWYIVECTIITSLGQRITKFDHVLVANPS